MGRGPTNENTNMYFQARKKEATYNERLWSREGAAELLGISVSTLADYELGNTKVVPVDKVVLMADLYNAPELITGYCMRECPVHGFLPLATEEKSLEGIALRLLQNFNEDSLKNMRDSLIEITADGKITKDEKRREIGFVARSTNISDECRECKYIKICRNGCQRCRDKDDITGKYRNYFCKSYKMFFDECLDKMEYIASYIAKKH